MGAAAPRQPSLLRYSATLHKLVPSPASSFLPQHAKSHTKANLKDVLRTLSAGGLKVGGLPGTKRVLAERLPAVLGWAVEQGRNIAMDGADAADVHAVRARGT